ncbi:MAG: PEP/pyruvate-binding domain-containing protein [Bacteroidota bacterium]|nr:PEP/pyruvate-binding domain-containing protein [Bacteroidota bacterium]
MKKNSVIAFLLTLLSFCSYSQTTTKLPDYLPELKSKEDFDLLRGSPLSNNFKGIECVKVVYRLKDKKIFYLESKKYQWHYRFTSEYMSDNDDLEVFNEINYSNSPKRKYVLATFNYNVNTKNYFLQFAASDNPNDLLIDELVQKVSETFFKKSEFKILLNTTILLRRKKEISLKHKVLTSDELFKNQNYQPICKGTTTGTLLFVKAGELSKNKDYSNNILIMDGSSNELPLCKGVIVNEFQTPLSHICLLTNNRKTPSAAQKDIFMIDSLKQYENKVVELAVKNESVMITPSNSSIQAAKKVKLRKPDTDEEYSAIIDLSKHSFKSRKYIGSKAANLAELKKISKKETNFETPKEAFAIPFYYYMQHVKNNKIDSLINLLLADKKALESDSVLDLRLNKIREAIKNAPLNKQFLDTINAKCIKKFGYNKVRFRSSSNCEDETGFNGAGLYTSVSGIANHEKKTYERAIKAVWASLWYTRAFKERTYFNFDNSAVCMGVLVHEAFDNEMVNGVAITKNLYRDYEAGFVINMQQGEEEVVSPTAGKTCEQVVSYMNTVSDFYNANRSADWISFSSLHPNSSLLSQDELFELTKQLEVIKRHFYDLYKMFPQTLYKDFAMDVEFKILYGSEGKKRILIKQARPYND